MPSWLEIYGKEVGGEDTLPALASDKEAKFLDAELISDQTNPPPRYTEATLLSAMEGAGKLVDDDELAEALKDKGLGTPATRASTIEHLIKEKNISEEKVLSFSFPQSRGFISIPARRRGGSFNQSCNDG